MEKECEIKQYKKRWINLLVFVIYTINNGVHWVQFSAINNIISEYYRVSTTHVEWTTCIFMLVYILFVIPVLYLLDKIKIRHMMILVSAATSIGAWLKVFSVDRDRFPAVLAAQAIEAVAAVCTYGVAARFTAEWFGIHEISRAGALALFGDQFGNALSFVVPVLMVSHSVDVTQTENGLRTMHQMNAGVSTIVLVLVVSLFHDQPKRPPSVAQALKKDMDKETLAVALAKMMKNKAFVMILLSYALNGGSINALSATLNEIILVNFAGHDKDGGHIGFLIMVFGMLGSPLIGYALDKTRKFKEVATFVYFGGLISHIFFAVALKADRIIYTYLAAMCLGVFFIGSYGNGNQIGIEILYPVSEDKCATIMLCMLQVSSLIITTIYSFLLKNYGDIIANVFLGVICTVCALLAVSAPIDLKRQKACTTSTEKEIQECLPKSSTVC